MCQHQGKGQNYCIKKSSKKFWAHHGHRLGTANKKGPTLSRKTLKNMARPTGFEPVTTAFGGHRYSAFLSGFNRSKSGRSDT